MGLPKSSYQRGGGLHSKSKQATLHLTRYLFSPICSTWNLFAHLHWATCLVTCWECNETRDEIMQCLGQSKHIWTQCMDHSSALRFKYIKNSGQTNACNTAENIRSSSSEWITWHDPTVCRHRQQICMGFTPGIYQAQLLKLWWRGAPCYVKRIWTRQDAYCLKMLCGHQRI